MAEDAVVAGPGRLVARLTDQTTTRHESHTWKVCVGLDAPVRLGLGHEARPGGDRLVANAVVVPPHVPHWLGCVGTSATFFIAADADGTRRLAGADPTPRAVCMREVRGLRQAAAQGPATPDDLAALIDEIAARAGVGWAARRLDARIVLAQARIAGSPRRQLPASVIAAEVGLSVSRLRHLFRAEVGWPMRRWALWERLMAGLGMMATASSITDAAHAAGFADHAHFTRTCRALMGQPPSAVPRAIEMLAPWRRVPRASR